MTNVTDDPGSAGTLADTSLVSRFYYDGKLVDERETGPGLPPKGWIRNVNSPDSMDSSTSEVVSTSVVASTSMVRDVPALDWSYGCSATSAGMYFGYYDRNGYPNLYTGPTNGGVFPLTNAVWGTSENPLSASHKGIDGRTTKGHVDDYWYSYSSTTDPYYGNWAEHSPKDSLADYMGTNQYRNWRNTDASTHFYFYATGLPMDGYLGSLYSGHRDGAYGMKLFAESRGYNVTSDYNQYIYGYDGNTKGFTYNQYKTEIDAGNPVFIQLIGHTMLGVGYSGTNQIIVHDTWDYSTHTMTWGGTYSGRTHYAVTVIHLAPLTAPVTPVAAFTSNVQSGTAPLTVTFTDQSTNTPASWAWDFGDGNSTNATKKNPVHTFASAGTYTVKLTATNAAGSNTVTKTGYILVSATTTSAITVTSPNGGETFVRGTSLTTTWAYTGNPGSLVKISLYKGSTYIGYIVNSTSIGTNGKGSYTWPLGLSGSTGSTFKVKIQSTTQPLINDTSDSYFSITTPVSPVAAFTSNVQSGTAPLTVTFTDQSTNTPASWAWDFGDGNSANATRQNPVHTFASAGTYTVKLTATNAAGSNTVTKTGYILVSAPTTSAITVTSPNGGETFVRGTSLTTTWAYTGNPGSLVRIDLYKDSTYLGYIVTSTSIGTNGKGSYTWPLGLSGSTGSTFKVKIKSTTQPLINDTSNSYFSITSAPTTP